MFNINILNLIKKLIPIKFKNAIKDMPIGYLWHLRDELRLKNTAPEYFGQFGEDRIMLPYLEESKGFFIDIGAGRPVRGSNTYKLYLRGWNGICVDPISINARLFKALRPGDQFLNVLIGSKNSVIDFWEFVPYGYSTVVESVAEKLKNQKGVKFISRKKKIVKPLSDIVPFVSPLDASMLSVDVEGFDLEVLKSNNWEIFRPRVICVEEWESIRLDSSESEIDVFLLSLNYERVTDSTISKIYVEKSYLETMRAGFTS